MSSERPTLKDVYEVAKGLEDKFEERLKEIPSRREMRLTVAFAVVTGSGVGSVVTALLTNLSPGQQAAAIYHVFF